MSDIMKYNIKIELECSSPDEFVKVMHDLALMQTKEKIKIEFTTDIF